MPIRTQQARLRHVRGQHPGEHGGPVIVLWILRWRSSLILQSCMAVERPRLAARIRPCTCSLPWLRDPITCEICSSGLAVLSSQEPSLLTRSHCISAQGDPSSRSQAGSAASRRPAGSSPQLQMSSLPPINFTLLRSGQSWPLCRQACRPKDECQAAC